jgi:hypothetical protein
MPVGALAVYGAGSVAAAQCSGGGRRLLAEGLTGKRVNG